MKRFIINLFPHDKLTHFTFVGVLPSLFLLNFVSCWITLIIITVVAIGIEVYDKVSGKGTAELMDIIYAIAGYLIVMILR